MSEFSTDALEKSFGKLRQRCRGTYFINNVQQISEKLSIGNAKLALHQDIDVSNLEVPAGHACKLCSHRMTASELEVLERLPELEKKVSFDEMQAVVYAAGYVSRKCETFNDDTFFYYEKFGSYTQYLDQGKLNIPNDASCQWCVFCYILFFVTNVKFSVCKMSLAGIFLYISDFYEFNTKASQCNILANILLNKLCRQITPTLQKEPSQKLLKLTL